MDINEDGELVCPPKISRWIVEASLSKRCPNRFVASKLFGVEYDAVTDHQSGLAKCMTFPILWTGRQGNA